MQNYQKEQQQIANYVLKMISLKTVDLKLLNRNITEQDVINYLLKIILVDKKLLMLVMLLIIFLILNLTG
ncbi:hypothetical protein [Spiroplasma citri]|uniref:hypothetical protein n=1 Tax=Spiroplasma citri TaxID=2133 RepID=UPI001EF84A3F|nr:hypothetical protein [Spiroplasma citri]